MRILTRQSIIPLMIVASMGIGWCAHAAPPTIERLATAADLAEVTAGLQVTRDRSVEQIVTAARQALDSGDFAAAAVILQRILESGDPSFIDAGPAVALPASELAARMTARLPEDVRDRLLTEYDRTIRDRWQVMKEGASIEDLATFSGRYRMSLAGLEALQRLAATHRDHGRHQQAAAAWHAVAQHSRATKKQRTLAVIAQVESLLQAELIDQAQSAMFPSEAMGNAAAMIAGREVDPQIYLRELLERFRKKHPARETASPVASLPAMEPLWVEETPVLVEIQKGVSALQRYYRGQGVVSSHAIRPVISGNVVLTRTMQELIAVDLESGARLWSVPNQEHSWATKGSGLTESSPFRATIAGSWHRRAEADSILGSIVTNGKIVVVVQEQDYSDHPSVQRGLQTMPMMGGHWNKLCAYDISNRSLAWQIGGPPTGPADLYGGMNFLGGALFVDDLLLTMGRRDDGVSLLAIDRQTGHLRWSVKLGVLPAHLVESAACRRIACPVQMVDGRVLCPTAGGALVAVNLMTRSVDWVYRYPIMQPDIPIRPGNGPTSSPPDAWWSEWREITCQTVGTGANAVVLLASPDSDQIHVVNVATGSPVWSAARGGGLYCLGTTNDVAVILESMAARGHDLKTGQLLWRAEIGEISGRGTVVGNQLIQPRRAGGVSIINLTSGARGPEPIGADMVYGALIPCEGGWITQTDQSLQRLPHLEALRRKAEARWEEERAAAASIELARLDLQAGDAMAARRRLEGVESDETKELKRESILAMFRSSGSLRAKANPPFDREQLGRELLDLCESDEERLEALRAQGDAARGDDDLAQALSFYLDGLELIEKLGLRKLCYWPADAVSSRSVRADRALLGAIQQILDEDRDTKTSGLTQILATRFEQARQSQDPFAAQQFLDRLSPLEWGRKAILENQSTMAYARSLRKIEPILLSVAGSRQRTIAARALDALARIEGQSGWRATAESLQRGLLQEHSGTPLTNDQTLAVSLLSQSSVRERLSLPIAEPWPSQLPRIEKAPERNFDVHIYPVRVQSDGNSLLEGLDVAIVRSGQFVRFTSADHANQWEVQLPGSPKFLRAGFGNYQQVEAFAIGRLLVLRVGSEVFGIHPFTERGEPRGSLTSLNLDIAADLAALTAETTWYHEPIPARLGIRHEGSRLMDAFGRTLSGLGAVRGDYLCYRSQGKLLAFDTKTGGRLWERVDLPPRCQVFGDDDCVYVWRTDEKSLQVFSAVDGRLMEERPWNVPAEDVLIQRGSLVWFVDRDAETSVSARDARDGSIVWTRRFAAKAIPFAMDQATIGVLEPEGLMHLLSTTTGASLGEAISVEMPEKVERIVCLHDAQRWYVAISGTVPKLSQWQSAQIWGCAQLVFVKGWLYGIERQEATIAWRRHLDSEPLPRHLSQVVPVITQLWRRPADIEPENAIGGVLRILDKRTGQELLTHRDPGIQPYFALLPGENREKLVIHLERETIRLNFNTPEKAETSERANENN